MAAVLSRMAVGSSAGSKVGWLAGFETDNSRSCYVSFEESIRDLISVHDIPLDALDYCLDSSLSYASAFSNENQLHVYT